jgi:hypothetical protein
VTFPSSAIAVNTAGQSYSVDWSTKPANITPDDYRAEVWIAGRKLGFADIRVVLNAKDLKSVPAGFAGVLKSKSLTLAFRLELGIVASVAVAPRNPTVDSAKTVQLTATVTDFHNQVIPNAVVTWASAPASIAAVSNTGLVTGSHRERSWSQRRVAACSARHHHRHPSARRLEWRRRVDDLPGNASHTGYNPVAMDSHVFPELWTKTVSSRRPQSGDGR